ncbi:sulfotransferase [Faunimonas sp. B44]|uniref:sulfotransferase n=1 Tax=Faunimonas sp. B44 TaxID=3461493 RepID=UPI0040444583
MDPTTLGRSCRVYHRLIEHWRTVLPVDMVDVRCEDLVSDRETGIRALAAAAGLEWNGIPSASPSTARSGSDGALGRRCGSRSTGRRREGWRRYAHHLGPLFEALGDLAPPFDGGSGAG